LAQKRRLFGPCSGTGHLHSSNFRSRIRFIDNDMVVSWAEIINQATAKAARAQKTAQEFAIRVGLRARVDLTEECATGKNVCIAAPAFQAEP
jgi:hypothetical protein